MFLRKYQLFFFALVAAILITFIKRRGSIPEDVGIGVIFSTFMAIGVILFSLNKTYVSDVFSYLFGNMLTIGVYDLVVALALLLITLVFFRKFKRELFLIIVDEELAYTCGVNASFVYYLLVTLFTVSVVIAIKLLGVILVSSLTVIPATVALFFSSRLSAIFINIRSGKHWHHTCGNRCRFIYQSSTWCNYRACCWDSIFHNSIFEKKLNLNNPTTKPQNYAACKNPMLDSI